MKRISAEEAAHSQEGAREYLSRRHGIELSDETREELLWIQAQTIFRFSAALSGQLDDELISRHHDFDAIKDVVRRLGDDVDALRVAVGLLIDRTAAVVLQRNLGQTGDETVYVFKTPRQRLLIESLRLLDMLVNLVKEMIGPRPEGRKRGHTNIQDDTEDKTRAVHSCLRWISEMSHKPHTPTDAVLVAIWLANEGPIESPDDANGNTEWSRRKEKWKKALEKWNRKNVTPSTSKVPMPKVATSRKKVATSKKKVATSKTRP